MKKVFVLLAMITLVACSSNSNRVVSSSSIEDISSSSIEETSMTTSESSENEDSTSSADEGTSSNTTTSTSENTSSSSQSENSSSSSSASSSSSSSTSQATDENTLTFNFYNNNSLPGCDTSKLNERLAAFMNQVATFSFVSSITNSSCQVIANAPTNGDTVLVVGSGSSGGQLQFTFANTIKSVSITAWSYHKPYTDYQTGNPVANVDAGASCYVNVDTNLIDLAPVGGEPVEKTETFEINGKTLKLYNKDQKNRAFIKSMTFTY